MPRGSVLRPLWTSDSACGLIPHSPASSVMLHPSFFRSSIRSAQVFMSHSLRDTVSTCQRHPVTGFRSNLDMETLGDRIRSEREDQKIERRDLASFAGIAVSTLSDLELGISKSTTKLHHIAARLGVRPEWLETGKGPKYPEESVDPDWTDVSGFAQAAGLGDGEEAQEYALTHKLKFRASSLARKRLNPNNLAVMYGRGDSMLPRIRSGDAILFDTSDTDPEDEALFLVLVPGMAGDGYSVKRCRMFGNLVFFDALNPEGDHQWRRPRQMDDKKSPITIIGRVRWIGSWED